MVHRGTSISPTHLLLFLALLLVSSFINVVQAGEERNAGRKLAGENQLTAKESLSSYWGSHISNGLPKPQFFMDKVSPLNALDLATFSKLAQKGSLSAQLHSFCSRANLLCGSALSTKLLNQYIAARTETKTDGKYFRESMLKPGTVMPMFDIGDKMPKRSFLPRVISSELPLTSNLFSEFKNMFQAGLKNKKPVSDKKSGYHSGYGDSGYQGSYDEKPSYTGGYDDKKAYHGGYDEKKAYHGGYGDSAYQGSYDEKPIFKDQAGYHGGYDEKPAYHGGYDEKKAYHGGYDEKPSYNGGYDEKPSYNGGYDEKKSYHGGYDEEKTYHGGYDEEKTYHGGYDEEKAYHGGYDEEKAYHGGYDEKKAYHGGYDEEKAYHGGYDENKAYHGGYDEKKVYHGGYDLQKAVYHGGYDKKGYEGGYIGSKVALHECAVAPNRGEVKKCVGSGEDMIDFATTVLGRDLELRTTENTRGINSDILIGSVKGINAGKTTKLVLCHQTLHPYLVYYCHAVPKVRVYEVDILHPATKVKINRGIAICHIDTSSWGTGQEAFKALGSGPGKIEVCHWIFENDLAWATAD